MDENKKTPNKDYKATSDINLFLQQVAAEISDVTEFLIEWELDEDETKTYLNIAAKCREDMLKPDALPGYDPHLSKIIRDMVSFGFLHVCKVLVDRSQSSNSTKERASIPPDHHFRKNKSKLTDYESIDDFLDAANKRSEDMTQILWDSCRNIDDLEKVIAHTNKVRGDMGDDLRDKFDQSTASLKDEAMKHLVIEFGALRISQAAAQKASEWQNNDK